MITLACLLLYVLCVQKKNNKKNNTILARVEIKIQAENMSFLSRIASVTLQQTTFVEIENERGVCFFVGLES